MRATPTPEVQVDDRPESSATWRTYHVRRNSSDSVRSSGCQRDGLVRHQHSIEEGHGRVPVLAEHPRVDDAEIHSQGLRDPGSQPETVVERVPEHAQALDPAPPLNPRAERVDRIRHDDEDSGPAFGPSEETDEHPDDLRVRAEVLEPGRVDREWGGRCDDNDIGVENVAGIAPAYGACPTELEHLLEIHDVRDDHLLAVVDEDEMVVSGMKQQVEGGRRADAASTAEDHDLHPSRCSPIGAASCSGGAVASSRLIGRSST